MTKDEALRMALEALEADELDMVDDGSGNMVFRKEQAITAIEKLLAQPKQEPLAWEQFYPDFGKPQIAFNAEVIGYVAPQRTWVELTDDEIWEAYMKEPLTLDCSTDELYALARTVEAKLKDKNNV